MLRTFMVEAALSAGRHEAGLSATKPLQLEGILARRFTP
jgi:hypothetical protein